MKRRPPPSPVRGPAHATSVTCSSRQRRRLCVAHGGSRATRARLVSPRRRRRLVACERQSPIRRCRRSEAQSPIARTYGRILTALPNSAPKPPPTCTAASAFVASARSKCKRRSRVPPRLPPFPSNSGLAELCVTLVAKGDHTGCASFLQGHGESYAFRTRKAEDQTGCPGPFRSLCGVVPLDARRLITERSFRARDERYPRRLRQSRSIFGARCSTH
jgi:hypothetical protein